MIVEGQRVSYVGDDTLVGVGAIGKALASAGEYVHVQWSDGLLAGQVTLTLAEDLVGARTASSTAESTSSEFEASFEVPSMLTVAVREIYDDQGEDAVLNALDEAGHLATLAEYANEAIGYVAMRVRQDPTFRVILGQLDEPEAESLLLRVASSLLADQGSEEI